MASKQCSNCGGANGKTAKFCKNCGHSLAEPPPEAAPPPNPAPDIPILDTAAVDGLAAEPGVDETPATPAEPAASPAPTAEASPEAVCPEDKPLASAPEAPIGTGFCVECLGGSRAGERVPIQNARALLVGAGKDADLCLSGDPLVSRRHASLSIEDGRLFLADEGSSNGTFILVNGSREVAPGDIVVLGKSALKIVREV